jgi:hypothetical protein
MPTRAELAMQAAITNQARDVARLAVAMEGIVRELAQATTHLERLAAREAVPGDLGAFAEKIRRLAQHEGMSAAARLAAIDETAYQAVYGTRPA